MTEVVNIRNLPSDTPMSSWDHDHVFVGRPTIWGNPFIIGRDGTRGEVIRKYEEWLDAQPQLLKLLPKLKGKKLVCYCAPLPCHADVLARRADNAEG